VLALGVFQETFDSADEIQVGGHKGDGGNIRVQGSGFRVQDVNFRHFPTPPCTVNREP
jgi:hypothetical protein